MATTSGFAASSREGGFAGAGTQRLESPMQRPSVTPGAGNISVGRVPGEGGNRGTSVRSPLAVYGDEFTFTNEELNNAILSNAPALLGSRMNPTVLELMAMQKKTNASPELQGVAAAIRAPFMAGYQQSLAPTGLLDSAVNTVSTPASSFPEFDRLTTIPSYSVLGNSEIGTTVNSPYNNVTNYFNEIGSTAADFPTQSTPSYAGLENAVIGNTMGSPYNNVIQYGMPVTGTVQDLPGALRNPLLSGQQRYHAGVDIRTAIDAPTVSMVPGRVAQIGTAGGYGAFVDVMNYDGTMSRYATHSSVDPNLKVGDVVQKGQVIGASGPLKPGGFSHLHLEQMTPSDRAFQEVAAAYNAGTTAASPATPGNMFGRTSSYDPNNIQTSTAGLLGRLGLTTGSRIAATDTLPSIAPSQTAVNNAPSPAPVQAVIPQDQTRVAVTPSLPPRTPTPSLLGRFATALTGIPGYDTGPGLLGGGFKPAEVGTQLLASSQPQVVSPVAAEAPPVNRPTASTSLASLLVDRAMNRNEERRRRRKRTTTEEEMMTDTIGGLLA